MKFCNHLLTGLLLLLGIELYASENLDLSKDLFELFSESPTTFLAKPMDQRLKAYEMFKNMAKERLWELKKFGDQSIDSHDFAFQQHRFRLQRMILDADGSRVDCRIIEGKFHQTLLEWQELFDRMELVSQSINQEDEALLLSDALQSVKQYEQSELRRYELENATQVYRINLKHVLGLIEFNGLDPLRRVQVSSFKVLSLMYGDFYTSEHEFGIDLPNGLDFDISEERIFKMTRKANLFSACLDGFNVKLNMEFIVQVTASKKLSRLVCESSDKNIYVARSTNASMPYAAGADDKGYDCEGRLSSSTVFHCLPKDHLPKDSDLKRAPICSWREYLQPLSHDFKRTVSLEYGVKN